MFRDTVALSTNPFGPSFPQNRENLERLSFLADLDRMPLRLDQCGESLRSLFCFDVLDLGEHMARFHDLMSERGYVFGSEGARSINSALVVIRGALGSGKTTLGSWMIAEMARLPGEPWAIFQVPEPERDTDEASIDALNSGIRQISDVPKGTHVALLVENVRMSSLAAAIARFKALTAWPRLFILTTHNLKILDADERVLGDSARIELFTLRQITAADADAYVAHRLPQFRDPQRPEIDALSPIFPFPMGLPGRFVQRGLDQGTAPVVLRQLNAQFLKRLTDHARHLRSMTGLAPVATAAAANLADYLLPDN